MNNTLGFAVAVETGDVPLCVPDPERDEEHAVATTTTATASARATRDSHACVTEHLTF
jgi:hypothetical protein